MIELMLALALKGDLPNSAPSNSAERVLHSLSREVVMPDSTLNYYWFVHPDSARSKLSKEVLPITAGLDPALQTRVYTVCGIVYGALCHKEINQLSEINDMNASQSIATLDSLKAHAERSREYYLKAINSSRIDFFDDNRSRLNSIERLLLVLKEPRIDPKELVDYLPQLPSY